MNILQENSAMRHLCEDFNLNGTRSIRGLVMKWIRMHARVLPAYNLGRILHLCLGIGRSQQSYQNMARARTMLDP
jgi:hypothetical protein